MTLGSSRGSIMVEHEVIMEANYTSGYLELFENLTKIVRAKIMNETGQLHGNSKDCKSKPPENPLMLVVKGWVGPLREVSGPRPRPASLISSGTPETSLEESRCQAWVPSPYSALLPAAPLSPGLRWSAAPVTPSEPAHSLSCIY